MHRADCPNMQESALGEEDKGRFINVSWNSEKNSGYVTTIQVEAYDRDGLLIEVSSILSELKMSCKSINARVNKKEIAVISLGLEITDKSDLEKVTKRIKQMSGIIAVTRKSN